MVGQTLVLLAVGLAVASAAMSGLPRGHRSGRPIDTWLLSLASLALWGAVIHLARAIMALDTSYAYVAEQTRTDMSRALRFSALWSGAEGSLLLFAAIAVSALQVGHRSAPRWQRFGTAVVAAGLGIAVLRGASPFDRLDLPPLSGAGMAPILEHFAMVIHPPLLYTGLCLALVPGLVRDRGAAHRWALVSLAVLTVAVGLGSAWAYVELGWGGWWAWDPIENVALIVWLLLAAGLHWQPLDPEHGTGSGPLNATVIWALCWPAVLGGAALTRTSLRTSVHAFADAAQLSVWLWPLVIVATIGAGLRINEDRAVLTERWPAGAGPSPMTRLPQAILAMAAFVIAAGTYRPFIGGDGTAGWFYSRTLYPLAIIGSLLVGIVPLWRTGPDGEDRAEPADAGGRRASSLMAGLPVGAIVAWGLPGAAALSVSAAAAGWRHWFQLLLAAAIGFGAGLVLSSGRTGIARTSAHLGVLFLLFGALAGTASTESVVRLNVGEAAEVDGHTVEMIATEIISEDPLRARAVVLVDDSYRLEPSVSVFPERNLRLPEVSTRTRPWLDSQAVLRDVDAEAGALITVLFRPWNQLVWWGVALLAIAALLLVCRREPPEPPGQPEQPAAAIGDRAGRAV